MRGVALVCALLAADSAAASQLVFTPTVGSSGGTAILHGNGAGSIVVPGVGGGLTVYNSDKTVTTQVPLVGSGGGAGAGYGAVGGWVISGGGGTGIVVGMSGFRTLAPQGGGFCLPPCLPTEDGVAPDGTVVTSLP